MSEPQQPTPQQLPPAQPTEIVKHKNKLQEYTQKAGIPLPVYQTINEGLQHAPRFRSTVWVDGQSYTTSRTFLQRKAAEQDAAKLALEGISKNMKDQACPMIHEEEKMFCKSILNEYAVKAALEKPVYSTTQPEGTLPVFISSLTFGGVAYTGEAGKNKKEAEQLAARAVIRSLLGTSESGTTLLEIIKSKAKIFGALQKVKDPSYGADSMTSNQVAETDNLNYNAQSAIAIGTSNAQGGYWANTVLNTSEPYSIQPAYATHVQAANGSQVMPIIPPVQEANVTSTVQAAHNSQVQQARFDSPVQAASSGQIVQYPPAVQTAHVAPTVQAAYNYSVPQATYGSTVQVENVINQEFPPNATSSVVPSPMPKVIPCATQNVLTDPAAGTTAGMNIPYHQFNLPKPDTLSEKVNWAIAFVPEGQEQPSEGGPNSSKRRRKNKKKVNKRLRPSTELAAVNQVPHTPPSSLVR